MQVFRYIILRGKKNISNLHMMAILDLAQCLCSVKNEEEREILKVYKHVLSLDVTFGIV